MKDAEVKYLVDAGPLAGAFWPADQWRDWSRQTLASLGQPAFTTETVFAEAAYHPHPRKAPALLQPPAALPAGLARFPLAAWNHPLTGFDARIVYVEV